MEKTEGWKTYEDMAGTSIYKDEDDILNPEEPYHWTLGTERELFRSVARGKKRLLDVGCGTARSCLFLAREVETVVGVDRSPKMIEIASRKAQRAGITNVEFRIEDAENLSFPDNSFDVVFFCGSLAIVNDPHKALVEAYRVLSPGGKVALVELNWEKAITDDPVGDRYFHMKKDGSIGLVYTQRGIEPSKDATIQGTVSRGSSLESELMQKFAQTNEKTLMINREYEDFQHHIIGAAYDEDHQFTPSEFLKIVRNAGFDNVAVSGYSFLCEMLSKHNLITELSSYMERLCKAEAEMSHLAKLEASEMLFVNGEKPESII